MSFALPSRARKARATDERPDQAREGRLEGASAPDARVANRLGIDAPRLGPLDGLRGVAILLVIVMHCAQSVSVDTSLVLSGIDRAAVGLARYGWVGVDLFFALSGFLITGILMETRGSPKYFSVFYIRRSLRIFPLYFAFLAVMLTWAALQSAGAGGLLVPMLDEQGWLWTYLANWRVLYTGQELTRASSHLWSLSVEEQFYLLWPLVLFITPLRRLLPLCVGVAIAALAVRCVLVWQGVGLPTIYVLTPTRMDPLVLGSALAIAISEPRAIGWLRRHRWMSVVAVCSALALPFTRVFFSADDWSIGFETIGFSIIAVGSAALLWLVIDLPNGWLARALQYPPLRRIGKHSYAIYLVQTPLVAALATIGLTVEHLPRAGGGILVGFGLQILVVAAVAFGISLVTWHVIEVPFLRLKDRFRYTSS